MAFVSESKSERLQALAHRLSERGEPIETAIMGRFVKLLGAIYGDRETARYHLHTSVNKQHLEIRKG